jgi:hypothetical protein
VVVVSYCFILNRDLIHPADRSSDFAEVVAESDTGAQAVKV